MLEDAHGLLRLGQVRTLHMALVEALHRYPELGERLADGGALVDGVQDGALEAVCDAGQRLKTASEIAG